FIGTEARRRAGRVREKESSGVGVGVEPAPRQATTHGVVQTPRYQAEPRQTGAEELANEHGVRVIGTKLVEARDAAVICAGPQEPQTLRAEHVDPVGTMDLGPVDSLQRTSLIPQATAEIARLVLRPKPPRQPGFPDVEVMPIELRTAQAGLLA